MRAPAPKVWQQSCSLVVWELMKDHKDPYIREAARFIKRAWLEQAMKYSHIPLINCEIERVIIYNSNLTAGFNLLPAILIRDKTSMVHLRFTDP
ncbi:unnamed protein product [Didymodactylos carnosus]|uniref:Uncharacterized protein n=1 Tax=Didymodactylos carnosus TaxID=1234261 RepID=A0A815ZGN7_9BILA|nr:unnamed protein product [Didymodactylos carnosus]CAF1582557.1 unnamed protein product [Didymodactylos carnosus]CAF3803940.1 unnamed protein product [Didymodactylos carnosus]CAF4450696.1 unnamed protein product [Didymodactylos carnosus]